MRYSCTLVNAQLVSRQEIGDYDGGGARSFVLLWLPATAAACYFRPSR